MYFLMNNLSQVISTIGLSLDIIGAFMVASEVVSQYKGHQLKPIETRCSQSEPPEKTDEFTEWENIRNLKMKIGLDLLTIGFLMQIAGVWL